MATSKELAYQAKRRYYAKHDNNIPTLDELREATAAATADTIRQIVKGQGIFYGYEVERDIDNSLPIDAFGIEKTEASQAKAVENQRIKRVKRTLEEQINSFFGGKLTLQELEEKKKALGL